MTLTLTLTSQISDTLLRFFLCVESTTIDPNKTQQKTKQQNETQQRKHKTRIQIITLIYIDTNINTVNYAIFYLTNKPFALSFRQNSIDVAVATLVASPPFNSSTKSNSRFFLSTTIDS